MHLYWLDFMLGEQTEHDQPSYTLKEVRAALRKRLKVVMVDVSMNIEVMLWRETVLLSKTEIMKNIVYNLKQ